MGIEAAGAFVRAAPESTHLLIRKTLGYDSRWGERFTQPLLPEALLGMVAEGELI